MKTPLFLAAASALFIITPAQAHLQSKSAIVVTGSPTTLKQWSAHATEMLESNLRYPAYLMGREPNEGIVRVSFRCSDLGAPTAVALADSSGFHELDNEAVRAVARIRTLHPLPEGLAVGQRYQAVVLFAKDRQSYDRQVAALRDDAARRNAWFGRNNPQVVMGISAVPVS